MYDVKDKQAVSQTRQIRQKDSIKHKDVTNFPKYTLKDEEMDNGSYGLVQQRTSTYHFNQNTVQLRDGEEAKLEASKFGDDPSAVAGVSMGIGMTAHHIIPFSLLRDFYAICVQRSQQHSDIKASFCRWQRNAQIAAVATATQRNHAMDFENDPDFSTVASACLWMSGNIFIGPKAEYRIDDLGDAFDYGGYRLKPSSAENDLWSKVENGNRIMDDLQGQYSSLKKIVDDHRGHEHEPLGKKLQTQIIDALDALIMLSRKNQTLHKQQRGKNYKGPAYNVADWICLGRTAILGRSFSTELGAKTTLFIEMYHAYLEHNGEADSPWEEYWKYFQTHLDAGKCARLEDDDNFVISRFTYERLCSQWMKCLRH